MGTAKNFDPETAWALLAGFALRAAFVLQPPAVAGDALLYSALAHNMLTHHTFGFNDGALRPTLIRLPGYPAFLAICFWLFGDSHFLPVFWIQLAVDLLACWLLGSLAARLWGRRAGLATLWLAALCPFTANYTAVALTETLSLFCVTLTFYALSRWLPGRGDPLAWERGSRRWAALLGAALGAAVLLRPDQGLLAASVLPIMLWRAGAPFLKTNRVARRESQARRSNVALGGVALAGALLVAPLLLWGVRNWRVFHVIQPLAPRYANDPDEAVPRGFQRWFRTWAVDFQASLDVYWKYDDADLRMADLPPRAFDSEAQRLATARILGTYNQTDSATPESDAAFAGLARERVAAHPWRYYGVLPVARLLDMWLRPRTETMRVPVDWWRFRAHPLGSAVALVYGLWNAAYLWLGAVGCLRWRRRGWQPQPDLALTMLGFVALRCALLLTLENAEPRYTLECYPVILLLGGLALQRRAVNRRTPS